MLSVTVPVSGCCLTAGGVSGGVLPFLTGAARLWYCPRGWQDISPRYKTHPNNSSQTPVTQPMPHFRLASQRYPVCPFPVHTHFRAVAPDPRGVESRSTCVDVTCKQYRVLLPAWMLWRGYRAILLCMVSNTCWVPVHDGMPMNIYPDNLIGSTVISLLDKCGAACLPLSLPTPLSSPQNDTSMLSPSHPGNSANKHRNMRAALI